MARPREFDIDQALEAAMNAFWTKGYTATSMADLMEAMSLQKGSIYKAFGNKHQLFLAALQHYLSSAFFSLKSRMDQAENPVESLKIFLHGAVETCKLHPNKGCFALNTVIELGPHDPETSTCVEKHFANIRTLVGELVARGQQAGLIRQDTPASDIAEYLITVQLGIVSSSKHQKSIDEKKRVADFALSQITQASA